jgi:hypothetical protein
MDYSTDVRNRPGAGHPRGAFFTMTINRWLGVAAIVSVGAIGLAGCQSASRALGMDRASPDEFRVMARAPLSVPPDYSLRPPAPGEPRPQELQPESAARAALLGQRASVQRSEAERLLATRAGGDRADPLIRYSVDDEFGDIAHKDRGFADFVMFWRRGQSMTPAAAQANAGATTPAPVNASAEAERLASLTGNQPIVIARQRQSRVKLPGM